MHILSYIFCFIVIHENNVLGKNIFDVHELKSLVDDLGDSFEDTEGLTNTISCENMMFLECYKTLLDARNIIQYKIVKAINKQILKKLEDYNVLVLSLVFKENEKIPVDDKEYKVHSNVIKAIHFGNSDAYCVIGFLSIFNDKININDKLADYIFFDDLKILKKDTLFELRKIIHTHFKSRRYLIKKLHNENESEIIENLLPKAKKNINKYSSQFCKIQFPWIKSDSWMWKKLQNSSLMSQKMYISDSLLEWQDLKNGSDNSDKYVNCYKQRYYMQSKLLRSCAGLPSRRIIKIPESNSKSITKIQQNHGRRICEPESVDSQTHQYRDFFDYIFDDHLPKLEITKRSETNKIHESTENLSQFHDSSKEQLNSINETSSIQNQHDKKIQDSLNTMIENEYTSQKFSNIDTFYKKVHSIMDSYVAKVIFYRVIHIVASALESYDDFIRRVKEKELKDRRTIDTNFIEFLHLDEEIEMFIMSFELYNMNKPLIFDEHQQTIKDIYNYVDIASVDYMFHVLQVQNPTESVYRMRSYLKDPRFHRDPNDIDFSDDTIVKWKELFDELKQINTYILYMTEIKGQ